MLDVARKEDLVQLDSLSIFHRVLAILIALPGCFILLIIGMAIFSVGPLTEVEHSEMRSAWMGYADIVIPLFGTATILTIAICIWVAGSSLKQRQRYPFCLAMAGIELIFMPLGTILGLLTFAVLTRDSVKRIFVAHAGIHPSEIHSACVHGDHKIC